MLRRLGLLATIVALVACLTAPAGAAPFHGSTGAMSLNQPIVTMVARPQGDGYWLIARDGGVFSFGAATFHGSTGDIALNQPIVGGAAAPDGNGYWLVASDGGIFSFGSANFFGSTGGIALNQPIVSMAAHPSGDGYWLIARDGGVFSFGAATFHGSTGGIALNQPIVGATATTGGNGYWLVARDGGIFAFGDAPFLGSTGGIALNQPIVAMASDPQSGGYWLAAADGGAFAFGGAPFLGSLGCRRLNAPILGISAAAPGDGYWLTAADGGVFTFPQPVVAGGDDVPALCAETLASGLSNVWDIGFTPDNTMIFTERDGRVSAQFADGGRRVLRDLGREGIVQATGEGGLLGMAMGGVDGRQVWLCFNSTSDVRVVRFDIDPSYGGLGNAVEIVTGIPRTGSGRHSGCRPRFGPDGYLWIGTGDAAMGTNPQNLDSLGGKVLRVDPNTGAAAPGNVSGLVYSWGHRNVQGLAVRPYTDQVFGSSHGPTRHDEVNRIYAANYGWDPVPGYNESVPMTDTTKFPDAVGPIWSSGTSFTLAPSGLAFAFGEPWGAWSANALFVAGLRGEQIRVLILDAAGAVTNEHVLLQTEGRIRAISGGPGGAIYVGTSNGSGDKIIRLTPG